MIIQTPMQTAIKHLHAFYAERNHADYTAFVQACQKFAEACRIPFVEASARVHASCSITH